MPRAVLEGVVMDLLWAHPEGLTGQQVRELLPRDAAAPAVTTVLTALSRLERKGRVERTGGRPQVYAATSTREEHTAALLQEILGDAADHEAVLTRFVGGISADDTAVLRRLLG